MGAQTERALAACQQGVHTPHCGLNPRDAHKKNNPLTATVTYNCQTNAMVRCNHAHFDAHTQAA